MAINRPIRCIVVDDEHFALRLIADYVRNMPGMEVVLETTSALEARSALEAGGVDVVFLDIQMPELTGLELARIVKDHPVQVVFTTAYSDYALEGFDYDATDYLLKPVTFGRFVMAANKVKRRMVTTGEDFPGFIFIKTEYRLQKVHLNTIHYIQGLGDYIILHTTSGKIISLERMKHIEQTLSARGFLRIHKSYIINMDHVDRLEKGRIVIAEIYLPVGETYKTEVKKRVNLF